MREILLFSLHFGNTKVNWQHIRVEFLFFLRILVQSECKLMVLFPIEDPAMRGMNKRTYVVNPSHNSMTVVSLVCQKLGIMSSNKYMLMTHRDYPLNDFEPLLHYGYGVIFPFWEVKMVIRPDKFKKDLRSIFFSNLIFRSLWTKRPDHFSQYHQRLTSFWSSISKLEIQNNENQLQSQRGQGTLPYPI